MSNESQAERRGTILKYAGVGALLFVAFGWILWQSFAKGLTTPALPKEDTTEAVLQSAALRAVMGMNKKQAALTSIAEIELDPEGKPGTQDSWGNELVLTMDSIGKSEHMTMTIISGGPDKKVGTADDITLDAVIEYIPNYKEYSLRSSETKRGE